MTSPVLDVSSYHLPNALGYLLQRNAKTVATLAERAFARDCDLGFAQFLVLVLLRDGLAETPGQLARILDRNSGAMTHLLDQLEGQSLIRRERSLLDRRSVVIFVRAAGYQAIERLLPRLLRVWNDILVNFDEHEYAELVRLQKKLLAALEVADASSAR